MIFKLYSIIVLCTAQLLLDSIILKLTAPRGRSSSSITLPWPAQGWASQGQQNAMDDLSACLLPECDTINFNGSNESRPGNAVVPVEPDGTRRGTTIDFLESSSFEQGPCSELSHVEQLQAMRRDIHMVLQKQLDANRAEEECRKTYGTLLEAVMAPTLTHVHSAAASATSRRGAQPKLKNTSNTISKSASGQQLDKHGKKIRRPLNSFMVIFPSYSSQRRLMRIRSEKITQ